MMGIYKGILPLCESMLVKDKKLTVAKRLGAKGAKGKRKQRGKAKGVKEVKGQRKKGGAKQVNEPPGETF